MSFVFKLEEFPLLSYAPVEKKRVHKIGGVQRQCKLAQINITRNINKHCFMYPCTSYVFVCKCVILK